MDSDRESKNQERARGSYLDRGLDAPGLPEEDEHLVLGLGIPTCREHYFLFGE
jgi:hypothetical protein